ncbi:hypothetical protein PEDI_52820 [Persicobacter diffluens]|uniref:Transposase IS204/IS1001/IS1096/IS1165 DDE domain-containing protein n=1 Tax=Persicobacter diffluens TaxID=981 RepID=A0AAN4W5Y9_9BACT|nr:hypothetical protein PEDI_52820 [Persicobacter diffluens]
MGLRAIFELKITPGVARTKLAQWYEKADKSGFKSFKSFESLKATFYESSEKIVNYFKFRSSNAASESFNAKLKNFRKDLRGVSDLPYMISRITKVFG